MPIQKQVISFEFHQLQKIGAAVVCEAMSFKMALKSS